MCGGSRVLILVSHPSAVKLLLWVIRATRSYSSRTTGKVVGHTVVVDDRDDDQTRNREHSTHPVRRVRTSARLVDNDERLSNQEDVEDRVTRSFSSIPLTKTRMRSARATVNLTQRRRPAVISDVRCTCDTPPKPRFQSSIDFFEPLELSSSQRGNRTL